MFSKADDKLKGWVFFLFSFLTQRKSKKSCPETMCHYQFAISARETVEFGTIRHKFKSRPQCVNLGKTLSL